MHEYVLQYTIYNIQYIYNIAVWILILLMSVEQSFNGFHHDGDFMVHSIWHVRSALEGGSSLHEPVRFVGRTYLRLDNLIPWSPRKERFNDLHRNNWKYTIFVKRIHMQKNTIRTFPWNLFVEGPCAAHQRTEDGREWGPWGSLEDLVLRRPEML